MLDTCSLDAVNPCQGDTPLLPTLPFLWTPRYHEHPAITHIPVLRPLQYYGILISKSNGTEWSTTQGVIGRVVSKSDEWAARSGFHITSTIIP